MSIKQVISIASVNLQDAQPPEEARGAFEDAIRAHEDKQRLISEAEAYSKSHLGFGGFYLVTIKKS